jgi:phosphomevalonate kinase
VTSGVEPPLAWGATVDSRAFFAGRAKLGLGSSAAVLCAWAGALRALARSEGWTAPELSVAELIGLHRRFQGGKGSGLDVAASYTGGAISFRSTGAGPPQIGSVLMPNPVGFAGIFAGRSASTPEFVAHYRAWRTHRPRESTALVGRLAAQAEAGCAALAEGDAARWLGAFSAYGRGLQALGEAIGADIVTAEHREIGAAAERLGVAYKVSGAGGGDLGLACAADADRLEAFRDSVRNRGFRVINVSLAEHGLQVAPLAAGWQR